MFQTKTFMTDSLLPCMYLGNLRLKLRILQHNCGNINVPEEAKGLFVIQD